MPPLIVENNRCPACHDEAVEDPPGSGSLRHRSNKQCRFQLAYDLDEGVCCRVLAAFGYPAKQCPKLLQEGGSNPLAGREATNLQKLSDLILETKYGMILDWRGDPTDQFLTPYARTAAGFGVKLKWKDDEDDVDRITIWVTYGGRTSEVRGRTGPADVALTSAVELTKCVKRACGGRLVTRVIAIYEPSDTWGYVTLTPELWKDVSHAAGKMFGRIFV